MTTARVPLPERLDGKRCLDVGTGDGFWASEMERRGAAEVVALDVDREALSVYDLDPTSLGHFDVVFVGSLLAHLRDPVLALERIREVCAGVAVIADTVELFPSLRHPRKAVARLEGLDRPRWWQPNRAALLRMIESAGFVVEEATGIYFLPTGPGHPKPRKHALPRKIGSPQGREELVVALKGIPHVAVRARPA